MSAALPARDASRLTAEDWDRMTARVSEAIREGWKDHATLERLAAHAIGCGSFDLRESEIEPIANWIACALRGDR
jgi:hypothetical protein